jgi:signal transduction histidine kinase
VLDTPTLQAVASITGIFQAALVLVVWRNDNRYAGMKGTKIGLVLVAAASILGALRHILPEQAVVLFSNSLYFIGAATTINGSLKLAGNRPLWRWQIPAGVIFGLFFLYYLFVEPSTPIRTEISGLSSGYLCFGAFLSFVQRGPSVHKRTRKTLAILMLVHSIVEILRSISVHYIDPGINFTRPSPVLSVFYIEFSLFALALVVIVIQMVSERLLDDLRGSEARINSAFQVASDAFAVFDGAGSLVVANERFREFFPDALPLISAGATITTVLTDNAERFGLDPVWLESYRLGAENQGSAEFTTCLPSEAWMQISVGKTSDKGLIFCWTDISAFKQMEWMLANELAHERTLALAQRNFVAMASHQFRTPLSIIDINAQLLEPHGNLPISSSELTQRATRIRRTVRRMIALIETMLGAASAEAGKIALRRQPTDLAALVHEVCGRIQEISPDRAFEIDITDLPPSVMCDRDLIDQVIGNILSNAIKYSDDTKKIVIHGAHDSDMALLKITDFGMGIAEDDQAMIFERFFRGHNVGAISGTGIGLTLARHIIDLHNGVISLDSRLNNGSTFTIELPIH